MKTGIPKHLRVDTKNTKCSSSDLQERAREKAPSTTSCMCNWQDDSNGLCITFCRKCRYFSPRIVRVITADGGFDVRDVQPAVLGVGDRAVRHAYEGRSPAPFVLENVGLVSEDDLVSSPAVRPNGNKVPHRTTFFVCLEQMRIQAMMAAYGVEFGSVIFIVGSVGASQAGGTHELAPCSPAVEGVGVDMFAHGRPTKCSHSTSPKQ